MNFISIFCFIIIALFSNSKKHIPTLNPIRIDTESVLLYEEDSITKIIQVDNALMDSLLKSSTKKYKVVLIYTSWCFTSREIVPALVDYMLANKSIFDIYLLSGEDEEKLQNNDHYLQKTLGFFGTSYNVKNSVYGHRRRGSVRISRFLKNACNECKTSKMGYSSFFVLGKNNQYITSTTWDLTGDQKIQLLKSLPLK